MCSKDSRAAASITLGRRQEHVTVALGEKMEDFEFIISIVDAISGYDE